MNPQGCHQCAACGPPRDCLCGFHRGCLKDFILDSSASHSSSRCVDSKLLRGVSIHLKTSSSSRMRPAVTDCLFNAFLVVVPRSLCVYPARDALRDASYAMSHSRIKITICSGRHIKCYHRARLLRGSRCIGCVTLSSVLHSLWKYNPCLLIVLLRNRLSSTAFSLHLDGTHGRYDLRFFCTRHLARRFRSRSLSSLLSPFTQVSQTTLHLGSEVKQSSSTASET